MTCEPGRASYTIRPANPADLPALQALAAACDVCRPGAHDPLWLAENAHGTPLGFIACTQVLDEMSLLSLAVHPAALILLVFTALGVISHNTPVTIASAVLLLMQQTFLARYLPWVEKNGLTVGIILLTIGVLAPLASSKISLGAGDFADWKNLTAIAVGIFVAWLAGRGVPLMMNQPAVVPGLIIGTVIGVAFLKGIPVGPLIAAGILSLFVGRGG